MKAELINVRPDARVKSNGCNGTLEREEWRDVKGYEGLYQVSSFGRVRSLDRVVKDRWGNDRVMHGRLLKQQQGYNEYLRVGLVVKCKLKNVTVHRLVMEAFVPNPDNLPVINHRNEVKTCNIPDNMEWCTWQYNSIYGQSIPKRVAKFTGYRHSEEIKQKMRGPRPHLVGRKLSKEHRESISRGLKGRIVSEATRIKKSKPIAQIDSISNQLIRFWNGASEAAQFLGISSSHISCVCRGKRAHSGGFIWKYKSDYENELNQ